MTQEEFDKAPLLDQILYDATGMLVENHPSIAKAMEEYHKRKLKLLGTAVVGSSTLSICCKKGTTLTNTANDIRCYKCNNCGKLTGIEDEYGRRIN